MTILETESFQQSLSVLNKTKYNRDYGAINSEIFSFFKTNPTLELVWMQPEFLSGNDKKRLNKTRIANSTKGGGKSYGYRIVLLCDRGLDTVNLLYIFPKFGPRHQPNIGDNFKKDLVKGYNDQLTNQSLVKSIFNNALLPTLKTAFADEDNKIELTIDCDHKEFTVKNQSDIVARFSLDISLNHSHPELKESTVGHLKKAIQNYFQHQS
ncbi:MAG: hypothetical protein JST50_01030 [Bacteroidetes bacterium]|nr:hypothetical protein [Bacteroidota bacterium]